MPIHIRTNNHERQFKYRNEVPAKVLEREFDYQDNAILEGVFDGYIYYQRFWYNLDQFERIDSSDSLFKGWHGYHSDSLFSGVVIKLSDDGETYWIGSYMVTSD